MDYPKIKIDLDKIRQNCKIVTDACKEHNITVTGIMKSFCAKPEIAQVLLDGGIDYLGDARLYNLMRVKHLKADKVLIRIPMKSTAKSVVQYADVSLNSELDVIRELDKYAGELGKIHKVLLMVELGDLREGVPEEEVIPTVREIIKLKNISFHGIGANLTCYGAIIPTKENLGRLTSIAEKIEEELGIHVNVISGGNSSSLHLLDKGELPSRINNLRIGEAIILGRETAYGQRISGTFDDAFILDAEIVEIKEKNSVPTGISGMDAFGNKPHYEDLGKMKRAILAVGVQDTEFSGMVPLDKRVKMLGASSDHLIVNITDSEKKYKVGDIMSFKIGYGALLKAMTSEYINKEYISRGSIKKEFCNC